MSKDIDRLNRHLGRSKFAVFAIIAFLAVLTISLLFTMQRLNNEQAMNLQSQAQTSIPIQQPKPIGNDTVQWNCPACDKANEIIAQLDESFFDWYRAFEQEFGLQCWDESRNLGKDANDEICQWLYQLAGFPGNKQPSGEFPGDLKTQVAALCDGMRKCTLPSFLHSPLDKWRAYEPFEKIFFEYRLVFDEVFNKRIKRANCPLYSEQPGLYCEKLSHYIWVFEWAEDYLLARPGGDPADFISDLQKCSKHCFRGGSISDSEEGQFEVVPSQ